jgi:hypothetical protein
MRIGISGTHGTGKTTLAQALCARLPGHVAADEPYWLLEAEGYEFGFPPSAEDYRALLARSVRSMSSPPLLPAVVFDRTPLDYLAYLAATGADLPRQAGAAALRPAFASLDLLVITLITPEIERVLPAAEMPGLRACMNDALHHQHPGLTAMIHRPPRKTTARCRCRPGEAPRRRPVRPLTGARERTPESSPTPERPPRPAIASPPARWSARRSA